MPQDQISDAWKAHRPYLVNLAFRILGDIGAAEDAVQEAFSRLFRAGAGDIEDERGWLTVVTSRLCLDQIRSAHSRRETSSDIASVEVTSRPLVAAPLDPADRVTLDDSLRLALVVVLERLTPPERVVFVLHDIFQMPFDNIAGIVGRTSPSCRQLARRARQKIEEDNGGNPIAVERAEYQLVTETFIAACSSGNLDDLLSVLDPDVSGEIDTRERVKVRGAERVARNLLIFWCQPDTTLVAQPVGGQPSLLGFVNRELAGVLVLNIGDKRVKKIHVIADPTKLAFVRAQLSLSSEIRRAN